MLPVDNDGRDVHTIWHDFTKKFQSDNVDSGCNQWKYTGYDMQQRVERWARRWNQKYPGEVQLVHCDDAVHASSDLLLIEHRSADDYMGISVVFIPQCTDHPMVFFLYPSNRMDLLTALKALSPKRRKSIA